MQEALNDTRTERMKLTLETESVRAKYLLAEDEVEKKRKDFADLQERLN